MLRDGAVLIRLGNGQHATFFDRHSLLVRKGFMNSTMTMEVSATLREQLAFLAVPAKRSSEQVSHTTEQLVKTISVMLNRILGDVTATRTREEFAASTRVNFPAYAQIMMAMGTLISAAVEQSVIDRLTYESLSELEADFRDEGQIFGEVIREQATFTAWTLRKINDLVHECSTKVTSAEQVEADREFGRNYIQNVLEARFNLDCLRMSLVTGRPIFPGPLDGISDGLRSAVDAYAWLRQARDLRHPVVEEDVVEILWDEEQQELLESSMEEAFREEY
jgi:hypothetical protein